MANRRAWLWIVSLLVLFFVISYVLSSQQPKAYPAYVSESPSPTGTKAIYTYLGNEFNTVSTWSSSPEGLLTREGLSILIMIEPYGILAQDEMEAYIRFMNEGNTILLLSDAPDELFNLEAEATENPQGQEHIMLQGEDGTQYQASVNSRLRLISQPEDQVLFIDEQGVVALKRAFGEGELIAALTPLWLRNDTILDYDHVQLVLSLLSEASMTDSTILFDEYIHGQQQVDTWATVYPKWFLILMLQGILVLLLWLWIQGKRFGPIFSPREEYVRFSDEGIQALAAWYHRGRRFQDSLRIQADYVKLRMQDRWGVPYRQAWKDSSDLLERKWTGVSPYDIQTFLQGLDRVLNKQRMSKQEYLLWSNQLDRLQKEVEKDEGGT